MFKNCKPAFTLSELLIALAILGLIATFTIPKILQSQQDSRMNSLSKEAGSVLVQALEAHKASGLLSANTKSSDLTPYINYVRIETAGYQIDDDQGSDDRVCSSSNPCLVMHNGGILRFQNAYFNGTSASHAIYFYFDPDGKYSGTQTGPWKSVMFYLYYNSMLRTRGTTLPTGTCTSVSCGFGPNASSDPPWFSWN